MVNVASTADTLESNIGSFLLSPTGGRALRSGVLDLHFPRALGRLFNAQTGIHTYLSASQSTWRGTSDTVSAVVVGIGALVYHDVARGHLGTELSNRAALTIEAGPSIRVIGGDVSGHAEDSLRVELLNSPSRVLGGLELGMQIEFGLVTAGFQFYLYKDFTHHKAIKGVTGGQLVAGFSIGGPIFSGDLTPP